MNSTFVNFRCEFRYETNDSFKTLVTGISISYTSDSTFVIHVGYTPFYGQHYLTSENIYVNQILQSNELSRKA